ncbi:teashirt [Sarotherodon galilaeus]
MSLTVIHNLTEHSSAQLLPPPPWGGRDSLFYCRCRASSRQCASRPRRAKSAAPRRPCVRHRAPHLHWISKATTATADKLSECVRLGASVALPHPITLSRATLCPLNCEEDDTSLDIPSDRGGGRRCNCTDSSRCFLILTEAGEKRREEGQIEGCLSVALGVLLVGKQVG